MRISYSSLDTYKTCPLKFKFQDIDKIKAPRNLEAVFGSSIHSALKYMFTRSPLYPTLDQVIDYFRNTWEEKVLVFKDAQDQEKIKMLYEDGLKMLKNFSKSNQPWNFNVVDLESRFETEIIDDANNEKHVLAGIMDRIDKDDDGSYEIIDYKTAKRMPSQADIDNDLQMSVYNLGLLKRWPHLSQRNVKLSFYFLKHGEKISTMRTEEQLENTKKFIIKNINEINERIKNNDFPPYPSVLCDWCGYKPMCPMWKHLYSKSDAQITKSETEMKEIIKEYFDLKAQNDRNDDRVDELKTLIHGFMDDQKVERVFGNEGYVTRKVQERISYDMEKAREILEPAGKWQEILDADDKKLEKILSSLPDDMQKKIISLRKIKKVTTLTSSKNKKGADESAPETE